MYELMVIEVARTWLLARREIIRNESGYSTESVIVTALLAALAIAAVGIIGVKVIGKANNISTD